MTGDTAKPAGSDTAPQAGAESPTPTEAPAGDEAPPPSDKPDCEKLLPKAMRDKYLAGAKFEPGDALAQCKFVLKPGDQTTSGSVDVTCSDEGKASMAESIKTIKTTLAAMKDVPGVGAATIMQSDSSASDVTTYDNDSNCFASMRLPKAIDPLAFTKDLLDALPTK